MKKIFDLDERYLDIISSVKEKNALSSDADALRYIIHEYENREAIADMLYAKLKDDLTRLRIGLKAAEKNSFILKDSINTLLYQFKDCDYLMRADGYTKHLILNESETHWKEIMDNAKQKADDRKAKKGES